MVYNIDIFSMSILCANVGIRDSSHTIDTPVISELNQLNTYK